MRFLLVLLLALFLAGCNMPDGHRYIPITVENYWGVYQQGALDMCLVDSAQTGMWIGVPPSSPNLAAIVETCQNRAYGLLMHKGEGSQHPVPMPTLAALLDGGGL